MDREKAYSVIEALANGMDPTTGEIFPTDAPYNNPEIIRALFYVLRNQSVQKKQKKTLEEKQKENLDKGLPKNYGLPWTDDCIEYVLGQYRANSSIKEIAQDVARKPSSIVSLLRKKEVITEEQAFAMGFRYQRARV